jgi:hypothetical protein
MSRTRMPRFGHGQKWKDSITRNRIFIGIKQKEKEKGKQRDEGMTGGSWSPDSLTSGSRGSRLAVAAAGQNRGTQRTRRRGCRAAEELAEVASATKRKGGGAQRDRQEIPHTRMTGTTTGAMPAMRYRGSNGEHERNEAEGKRGH